MKNAFTKILGSVAIMAIMLGASSALAWTNPSTPPPYQGDTFAPLHTGSGPQVKIGDIGLDELFANSVFAKNGTCAPSCVVGIFSAIKYPERKGLGVAYDGKVRFYDGTPFNQNNPTRTLTVDGMGWVKAENITPSSTLPTGTINQTLRHNGTTWEPSSLLQNTSAQVLLKKPFTSAVVPFMVDLSAASGPNGRNAVGVTVSQDQVDDGAVLMTNADGFSLWSWGKDDRADLAAGKGDFKTTVTIGDGSAMDQTALTVRGEVQLSAGGPDEGKVLASNDTSGNSEWGVLKSDVTKTFGANAIVQVNGKCDSAAQTSAYSSQVHCENADWHKPPLSIDGEFTGKQLLVRCPSGTTLIGGGGQCQRARKYDIASTPNTGNGPTSGPKTDEPNTWQVICGVGESDGLGVAATAFCLDTSKLLTDVAVNTYVETDGAKRWRVAGSGQAPQATAQTCMAAYNGYNNHTFLNSQVGYIKQTWAGHWGSNDLVLVDGPGDGAQFGAADPNVSDSDIIVGSCAVWTLSQQYAPAGIGSGVTALPNNPTSKWQGKIIDPPTYMVNPNDPNDTSYAQGDIWYTYLKY